MHSLVYIIPALWLPATGRLAEHAPRRLGQQVTQASIVAQLQNEAVTTACGPVMVVQLNDVVMLQVLVYLNLRDNNQKSRVSIHNYMSRKF